MANLHSDGVDLPVLIEHPASNSRPVVSRDRHWLSAADLADLAVAPELLDPAQDNGLKRPEPACRLSVAIPVRNEAGRLRQALRAFHEQTDSQTKRLDCRLFEVVVFANNCTDATADVVIRFQRDHPELRLHLLAGELPPERALVGLARRVNMNLCWLRMGRLGAGDRYVACTDGDSIVASDWVVRTLEEFALGADAVGGRVRIIPRERRQMQRNVRLCHAYNDAYERLATRLRHTVDPLLWDPSPMHANHLGASLAATARAYAAAGGMPAIREGEDVAFYHEIVRSGGKFRHSPLVKVWTTARRNGRVGKGMAGRLREWSQTDSGLNHWLVPGLDRLEKEFRLRRALREFYRTSPLRADSLVIDEILALSQMAPATLNRLLASCGDSEQAWFAIQEAGLNQAPLVPVRTAVRQLRSRLSLGRKPNLFDEVLPVSTTCV